MPAARPRTPAYQLLWARQARDRRRQRPLLSRDAIVRIALELADREGIHELSMRRLATTLGSGAASLYRHVASRDDLLDLMIDAAYAELATKLPDRPSGDWRTDLRLFAIEMRAMLRRHPWLAAQAASRPPLGPNALRCMDVALAAASYLNPDITVAAGVLGTLASFVLGSVTAELAEHEAQRRTGLSEAQWHAAVAPYIRDVIASGRYPAFARRVLQAEDVDAEQQFEFGLACLLDGAATRAR